MSAALPKPETTLALIFGASKWPDCKRFEPLPSVEASSDAIYDLLRRSDGLGLPPRNVKNLFGSFEDAAEQLSQASSFIEFRRQEMSERGSRLTDLVIYYAGHGDFEGEAHDFYLTVRRTHSNHPMLTSITARELGNWVRRNAFDLRTYLMIDCCFAAAVQYGFMTSPLSLAELKLHEALPVQGPQVPLDEVASAGVALLAASGLNTPAIASPGETFTRFTAALLDVMEAGHPHLPDFLSLSNVHSLLSAKLTTSYPDGMRPELRSLQQTHGRVELVGLFPNVARMRERAERERIERDARAAAARAERERSHAEKERIEREANEEAERLRQQDEHERMERNTLEAAKRAEWQRVEQERLDHERRGLLELLRQRYRQPEQSIQGPAPPEHPAPPTPKARRLSWKFVLGSRRRKIVISTLSCIVIVILFNILGFLFDKDFQAAERYRQSADRGDASAQVNLGTFYEAGRGGLPKDDTQAARLYKLAADQGDAVAQDYLGDFYRDGLGGLQKDDKQAARLYRLAADQGDTAAQVNLGLFYENSRGGLPKDERQAARLYKLAADKGYADAQDYLGDFYRDGLGGLQKDDKQAARLYKLAADQGNAAAQVNLGVFYEAGRGGLPKDDTQAARLYKLAADQGYAVAQVSLGQFYEDGRGGLPKDSSQAARLCKLAADQGNAVARGKLGQTN